MNEKVIHSFEGTCPLTHYGIYGIKKSFNMPNFPCSDKGEQLSLKKHLMYKHNLSNTAANKIVLDRMNLNNPNRKKKSILTFNSTQELFSHSVHWHKGQCPFSYGFDNVYNLTAVDHNIKNFDCRHRNQCLLLSHLRVSHNLNIKSAKKIVKAIMSASIESKQKSSIENEIRQVTLFQKDDFVINTNPNIYNDDRRFRHYCPLVKVTNGETSSNADAPLLNIPCTKINEKFLLFAHLQHYHQMNGEVALRLIRAIRTGNESAVLDEVFQNSSKKPTTEAEPTSNTVADDIDIVPYKCTCPYSSSLANDTGSTMKSQLKKFSKFVKNVPCDRPCPVNLYRHLRNYHKVDLQNAKEITRTIMTMKNVKLESQDDQQQDAIKRNKVQKLSNLHESEQNHSEFKGETKSELFDFFIGHEFPEDWMEQVIRRLDSLADDDPFAQFDKQNFSSNDLELIERHRLKVNQDRQRIREERKTKSFEEIMEDLVGELSRKTDFSSLHKTFDEALRSANVSKNSTRPELLGVDLDTSNDAQDDLEQSGPLIDPGKSIGHSVKLDELETSTYVVFPLENSSKVERKTLKYIDRGRRNTFNIDESSSDEQIPRKNERPNFVRLHSEGFDPEENRHVFDKISDARSTFSIPTASSREFRFTEQEARRIVETKLAAFVKGHLTRQLFRTEHVKRLIETLRETKKFAANFQNESLQTKSKLDAHDIQLIDQLIDQAASVLNEIQAIFFEYSPSRQILMILRDEQTRQFRAARNQRRIYKDLSQEVIQRPIIEPQPPSNNSTNQPATRSNTKPQSDYSSGKAKIRRHVTTISTATTANRSARPLKKSATTVQRQNRPSTSNNVQLTSNTTHGPRSSSANTAVRPPLRTAPASPLFRNRFK